MFNVRSDAYKRTRPVLWALPIAEYTGTMNCVPGVPQTSSNQFGLDVVWAPLTRRCPALSDWTYRTGLKTATSWGVLESSGMCEPIGIGWNWLKSRNTMMLLVIGTLLELGPWSLEHLLMWVLLKARILGSFWLPRPPFGPFGCLDIAASYWLVDDISNLGARPSLNPLQSFSSSWSPRSPSALDPDHRPAALEVPGFGGGREALLRHGQLRRVEQRGEVKGKLLESSGDDGCWTNYWYYSESRVVGKKQFVVIALVVSLASSTSVSKQTPRHSKNQGTQPQNRFWQLGSLLQLLCHIYIYIYNIPKRKGAKWRVERSIFCWMQPLSQLGFRKGRFGVLVFGFDRFLRFDGSAKNWWDYILPILKENRSKLTIINIY